MPRTCVCMVVVIVLTPCVAWTVYPSTAAPIHTLTLVAQRALILGASGI